MCHITNWISQRFGGFASYSLPQPLQRWINKSYVFLMKLDMREFEAPEYYSSLNALFTRHLKISREFSDHAYEVISPCDALISECGVIEGVLAMQIKGMHYDIDALLGSAIADESHERVRGGDYMNFYLSPRDYHRYHAPCDMQVLQAVYIPGKLYPVNMPALKKIASLFVENERVVLECEHMNKRFFMVMVGALNVGKMQIAFEPRIQTNAAVGEVQHYSYENLHLKKGDDFGCFEMGSTIVMLSEKELFDYKVGINDRVHFTERIALISKSDQA